MLKVLCLLIIYIYFFFERFSYLRLSTLLGTQLRATVHVSVPVAEFLNSGLWFGFVLLSSVMFCLANVWIDG